MAASAIRTRLRTTQKNGPKERFLMFAAPRHEIRRRAEGVPGGTTVRTGHHYDKVIVARVAAVGALPTKHAYTVGFALFAVMALVASLVALATVSDQRCADAYRRPSP
jgi:hypothetical protein